VEGELIVSELSPSELTSINRRLFETSLDLILVTDSHGTFIQVSPSSRELLGYLPNEMIGHSGRDFIFPDDLESTRREMRAARNGRATRHFRCRYLHRSGTVVPLVWMAVWSEPDHHHFFVGRDMTESDRIEAQLRQAQKMEAVGQLTGGLAHDFNNILMVIMANVDAIEEEEALGEDARHRLQQINGAAQRASDLTRQLLAFSRKQPLRPQTTDLNQLVSATGKMLQRALGEHIVIDSKLAQGLWTTNVDPAQFEAALLNLSVNARDAMPDGGRLLIETANVELDADYAEQHAEVAPGPYAMLAVTDTGTGMPREIAERVFEPFFTTKEVGKGSGLGLSMVYGFIKQSKGHIKLYSEPGHGTSVKIYLPRHEGEADAGRRRKAAALPGGRERILLVEDDPHVRESVVLQLRSLGYAVTEAESGAAGLAVLESGADFALLLTDLVMPGRTSGAMLVEEARRRWPSMHSIVMSGYSENALLQEGKLDAGIRLLVKPFRKADLARTLRETIDGTEPTEI
jgi:PAS domain S-box-containing protein